MRVEQPAETQRLSRRWLKNDPKPLGRQWNGASTITKALRNLMQ